MQTLSVVSFILAGVFLLISIAIFFLFDIHRVIGDISGATARKAIENIRQQNEETGDKAYKPSRVNMERGKVTDKISKTGNIQKQSNPLFVATGTSELKDSDIDLGAYQATPAETTVLDSAVETNSFDNQYASAETTVLSNNSQMVTFSVDYEIGFCGSSEIIV